MDNISEARTEVESIVAAPSNHSQQTTITSSVSQEPIDGGARNRLKSYDESESGDLNVSKKIVPKFYICEFYESFCFFFSGLQ